MSKNMTRKGLAIGAAFALVGSALVAVPAQAAGEISLAVTSGTGNGSVLGDSFSVKATLGALVPSSSNDQVKFRVTNAAEATLTLTVDGGTAPNAHSEGTQVAGDAANYAAADSSAAAAFTVSGTSFTTAGPAAPTVALTYSNNQTLVIGTGSASSHDVVVTAFLDTDNDNTIDAGEFSSSPLTVKFVKADEVTWSAAYDAAPALGDTSIKATVTNDKDINIAQFAAGVEVGFATVSGSTYTTAGAPSVVDNAGVFTVGSAVDADGKVTFSHNVAAGTYVAVAINANTNAEISTEVLSVVAAATVVRIDTPVVESTGNVNDGTTTTPDVRNGTASLAVSVQAYKTYTNASTNTKAAAGTSVKITISEGHATNNTNAASFAAGGKTLKDTTGAIDKIDFVLTADANGKVSFNLAVAGTVAGTDTIVINATSQGVSSATQGDSTVAFIATSAASIAGTNLLGTGAVMKVAAGSSYTLSYAALDNFGSLLSGSYRVVLIESGANPDVAYAANVVNGVTSFNLTDSTSVTESYSADLQVYNTATGAWDDAGLNAVTDTPTVGSSNAAASLTLVSTDTWTAGTTLALNNKVLGNADTRLAQTAPEVGPTGQDNAANNVATLSGQVSDAASVSTYSTVTLSAANVMFVAGAVSKVGSITVQTNATGAFGGVKVYSNTAGKVTITATAGSATKTVDVTFADAAKTAGATLTITAPSNVLPGSTLSLSAKLVDKWGNPVAGDNTTKFAYTYSGPGLMVGSAPTAFGTDGVAKLGYLLGSNDSGTITVTFSYDSDNGADPSTTDTVTATKTITIGKATETVIGSYKGRVAVRVEGQKGQKLSVKVGTKWYVVASVPTDKYVWSVKSRKGAVVKVSAYLNGDLENTATITVK